MMNCDRIAPLYRWFEYASFGPRLERHRFEFLSHFQSSRRALLLGDGDGRFTTELARMNHAVCIDSIDLSPGMLRQAARRFHRSNVANPERVRFLEGDARTFPIPERSYDLIATHFFLDCFRAPDLHDLVCRIKKAALPQGQWVISEFRQPRHGFPALHGKFWLNTMYFFFRLATGLETDRLPEHRVCLRENGFTLCHEKTSMLGLIGSELWTFQP